MKTLLALTLILTLYGCGGDAIECFPGTEWSDRVQGCVRVIPDDNTIVRYIPEDGPPFVRDMNAPR